MGRRLVVVLGLSLVACSLDLVGTRTTPDGIALPDGAAPEALDGGTVTSPDGAIVPIDASTPFDAGPGAALSFTPKAYVAVPSFAIPTDFTIEAWVRPAAFGAETYVIAKDRKNQGQGQFRLGFDGTGHAFFLMTDASGSDHGLYASGYVLQSSTTLPIATWSHLAVTKDGPTFTLYIDGAAVKTAIANLAFVYGGPDVELRFAARVDSNGTAADGAFDGAIDEVRIWKFARTAAQVAAARATPIDPAAPVFGDLAGYWRFDDGTGVAASDATGGHPGTLVAGPKWITATPF